MTKLFVGGFPLDYTEMQLVQLIATYGTVATVKIIRDRKTKKCKGYAFIEMEKEDDAVNTMAALDGAELDGRALKLNIVPDQPAAPAPRTFNRSMPPRSPRPEYNNGGASTSSNDPDRSRRPRLRR